MNAPNTPTIDAQLPQQLPLAHQADVLVIGGGPGGIGAAIAAAREGADVLLVEHYGFLGGMATAGEVNPFMQNHLDGQSLDTGIFQDWLNRIEHLDGLRSSSRVFDPNLARFAAEDLCLEAGVRLLYHHRVAHAVTEGRQLKYAILHSKSGLTAAKAKQFIDCTGDGDLAALAGCKFEYGNEESGQCQPMTLCFKLKIDPADAQAVRTATNSTREDFYHLMLEQNELIQDVYAKAKAAGRIDCPRENVLMFRGVDDDVVHFNTTRVIQRSSIDGSELSDAEVQARRQILQLVEVLQKEVPIFKNARLYSVATQIGIRESRRILGRAYLTEEDFLKARTYPDSIARVTYPIDIHNPNGSGTRLLHMPKGRWYDVPFGCLLPRDLDNLAIGSRCISCDHALHSSVRVMAPVCSIGQAAGTAAAMAVQTDINVCEVDGIALKQRLIELGRNLVDYDPNLPDFDTNAMSEQAIQRKQRAEATSAGRYSA